MVLAPLALLIVFIMLLMSRCTVIEALIVLLAVPFSLIGAVWCLYLLDYNLSVAVWVGTIALAGLDAEIGILMLLYLNLAYRQHELQGRMRGMSDLTEAIVEGAVRRLRPKLMTGMALLGGLAPIFWSTGAGADVMKRIAAPMVGGIASALVLVLVVFPAIYALWKGHDLPSRLGSIAKQVKLRRGGMREVTIVNRARRWGRRHFGGLGQDTGGRA